MNNIDLYKINRIDYYLVNIKQKSGNTTPIIFEGIFLFQENRGTGVDCILPLN